MFDYFLTYDIRHYYSLFAISFILDILCSIKTFSKRHSVFFVVLHKADVTFNIALQLSQPRGKTISIFHGRMVWIEKSVTRVSDRSHEACLVMPNSNPE